VDGEPPTPPELIAACAAERLTLFQVPVEVPYIAISEKFVATLQAEREAPLIAAVERNERLMRAASAGGGLASTVQVLGTELGRAVAVVDGQRRLLANVGEAPPRGDDVGWAVVPVVSIDRTEALLLLHEDGRPLSIDERAAANQAAALMALQLVHERALRETHRRFALELVELLEAGDPTAAGVASRLRAFGIASDQPLVVIAGECVAPDGHVDEIERTLVDGGHVGLVVARGRHVLAVAQWPGPSADLSALGRRVAQVLGEGAPVGVGGVAHTSARLHHSLAEALSACAVARRRQDVAYVTHDELGSHALLLALQDAQIIASLSQSLLDPLADYDARRGAALLHTLTRFLESNCHWQATADELHIHVNTLRHRIVRIEQLTRRSLDTIDGRVDLFLALRARTLGAPAPPPSPAGG
jgi:hypothetical protein